MKRLMLAMAVASLVLVPLTARAETTLDIYGHADVSMDYVNRDMTGLSTYACPHGPCVDASPYWQMSSNLSYLGFRVTHDIGDSGLKALLQFETQVDVSATPNVKDSLGSRDSYIGLAGGFGAIKLGKSDTPYKKSTARMDPFSATVGDYNSIMGNTGGDNRAEFDLRLPHAAWWESPKMGGVNVAFMVAPSQNRASDSSNAPQGEFFDSGGLCSGSSPHGSGALFTNNSGGPCADGSFGDAYSASVFGGSESLFWTVAYEVHQNVNRSSDDGNAMLTASGLTFCPTGDPTCVGVHDESAIKAGAQWKNDATTVNFIFESMTRDRGSEPSSMDERTRTGQYLSAVQKIGGSNEAMVAWAHADKTSGDPNNFTPFPSNEATMIALGYRMYLDKSFYIYGVYAVQNNSKGAHYDLGASGHGIPIVGRDGSGNCDGGDGCIPGDPNSGGIAKASTISAFSIGLNYTFSAPFSIAMK